MSYDPSHDTNAFSGDPLPAFDKEYIDTKLTTAYANAGFVSEGRRQVYLDEALELPSTWGRRLLHARPRDVYLIEGRIV